MTPERWRIAEEIVVAAWDLPEEDRAAFVSERCGTDGELQAQVTSLVQARQQADHWTPPEPVAVETRRRFGPYELEHLLGRGGMGAVYLAHRADGSFEQKAAVKIIGLPFELEPFRQRFKQERQILAQLNHPNITHLLDGGVTEDGELYLAMEYVDGVQIDQYVRDRQLPVAQRLNLFRQVADAVAYAHQNLIAHRDLKPSNILVTAAGVPKLLDFGTAKLLSSEAGEVTGTGTGFLTVSYASPEQLQGQPGSALSDVFALGALLYELLSGEKAFTGDLVSRVSATDGVSLGKSLGPDLDRIVGKALQPEPKQRYASAEQLSEDVRRYLAGEPVLAHPPSVWYRGRKFLRRNAWSAGLAALFVAGMAAATAYSMQQARVAQRQAIRAQRISTFLSDMLSSPNPSWYNTLKTKGKGVTILDVLGEMQGRLGTELAGEPEVEAELRRSVGRMYSVMGQHAEARQQLELALQRQLAAAGRDNEETAKIHVALASENYLTLRAPQTLFHAEEALAIATCLDERSARNTRMQAYNLVALARLSMGEPERAEPFLREAVRLSRVLFGSGGATPVNAAALSTVLNALGRFAEAKQLALEARDLFRSQGAKSGESFSALYTVGLTCLEQMDLACAAENLDAALPIAQASYGKENAYALSILANQGLVKALTGNVAAGRQILEECQSAYIRTGGPKTAFAANMEAYLGRIDMLAGKFPAAERHFRKAQEIYAATVRASDIRLVNLRSRLGEAILKQGRRDEALPLLTESYRIVSEKFGPEHVWTVSARARLPQP